MPINFGLSLRGSICFPKLVGPLSNKSFLGVLTAFSCVLVEIITHSC